MACSQAEYKTNNSWLLEALLLWVGSYLWFCCYTVNKHLHMSPSAAIFQTFTM